VDPLQWPLLASSGCGSQSGRKLPEQSPHLESNLRDPPRMAVLSRCPHVLLASSPPPPSVVFVAPLSPLPSPRLFIYLFSSSTRTRRTVSTFASFSIDSTIRLFLRGAGATGRRRTRVIEEGDAASESPSSEKAPRAGLEVNSHS